MNFLEAYKIRTKNSEPNANYHFWCAMTVVSSLLSRKCYIPQGYFTIYPNLYVILVSSKPGMRKSTAMNFAKQIIRANKTVPLASEASSREALIDLMKENRKTFQMAGKEIEYHPVLIAATELKEFFGLGADRMESFLTAVWDEPSFEDKTRKHGRITIPGPYVTMIACCVQDWISTQMRRDVISGGFARRAMFVYADELNCFNPWPVLSQEEEDALVEIYKEADRICKIQGQFFLTQEALKMYSDWYIYHRSNLDRVEKNLEGYFEGKHTLLLKLCMCLSACFSSDKIITTETLQQAMDALDATEQYLPQVFEGVGRNELKPYMDSVMRTMERLGEGGKPVPLTKIHHFVMNDLNTQEFAEVIQSLIRLNKLEQTVSKGEYFLTVKDKTKRPIKKVLLWDKVKDRKIKDESLPFDMNEVRKEEEQQQAAGEETISDKPRKRLTLLRGKKKGKDNES